MVILVVEDDTSIRKLERMILERSGNTVVEAESGEEAIKYLQQQHADVVIIDIVMPEMSGIELLNKMKSDPMMAGIPAILCSSISEHELVQKALSLGIAGYILKPITANKLNKKIQDIAGQVPPVLKDPNRTRNKLGLDMGEYKKLLQLMIDDAKRRLVDIGKQVEVGEFRDFRRFMHDISNSAENLGAKSLQKTAHDANSSIPNVEPELREKYFFKLRSEIERVRDAMTSLA